MGSIDDTKKKLNIDNLDKNSRTDMFNKFVEKGGKIVEDKTKKAIHFNRDQQKYMLQQQELNKKKYQQKQNKGNNQEQDKNKNNYKKIEKKEQAKNIKRYFTVFMEGLFQGIFTVNGFFTKKFCLEIHENLISILTDLKQISQQLTLINNEKKWDAIDIMNLNNSFAFEIIIRVDKLYEMEEFNTVSGYFKNQNKIICPDNIINIFYNFFKKLLILYPYWETIKDVLWNSEQYYQDLTSISPIISRSKIHKIVDKIYSYFFPRILTLLNYTLGNKIPFDYNNMFAFMNISSEEDIGSISKELIDQKKVYFENLQKEKEKKIKEMKDEIDKKDEEKIPKYIQKGLEVIDSIVDNIQDIMMADKNMKNFEANEKMLQLYCLLNEFDKHYSFILTTSQIKYDPKAESGVKVDIKFELDNLYIKFNEILALLKEYVSMNIEFKKINDTININVMLKEQEINSINVKRSQAFNDFKTKTSVFFKKFAVILQKVIQDYDGEKSLLKNGDDKLHFEIKTSNNPKFENVKIINAIILTFSFASAIFYYLTRGKLSEKGLYFNE